MGNKIKPSVFSDLDKLMEGNLVYDSLHQILYSTDASVYREIPLAVAFPKGKNDIEALVRFASQHGIPLIPRAAGTSLAGQVVGKGMVVDVSKYMQGILEVNTAEQWVRVEPGVIRNELNHAIASHGLFFAPITATATRAMIGGMVGNNSCGQNSIVYGSVRDHILEVRMVMADGVEHTFSNVSKEEFSEKKNQKDFEASLYQHIYEELSDPDVRNEIKEKFPKEAVSRRNTGYAVDALMDTAPFGHEVKPFNFGKLICGSEGTLGIITEVKIHVNKLPPPSVAVVAVHCHTVRESLIATQYAMTQSPSACELMDKVILDCTKENRDQIKNRYFVEGDPAAVLLVEFRSEQRKDTLVLVEQFIDLLRRQQLGYAYPVIWDADTAKVWELRSAGLGLLANLPGDSKAVACIEDTAVAVEDLADYIDEFDEILAKYNQKGVYYAHAGAGEIHLRPILNLKDKKDVEQFYQISKETAELVRKYKGSLSGEHGDGRLRAPFIPLVMGEENYQLFRRIKHIWDPDNIFNPGKIVDAAPMTHSLRYEENQETRSFDTIFDFSSTDGILRAVEKCNGSGDCRKLPLSGGTMCPSYQATRQEKDSTRARANTLREILTRDASDNPFAHPNLKEVMDLCLSCKGCSSECPSNVDMATLKAEFLHQFYLTNKVPLRSKLFSAFEKLNALGSKMPGLTNFFLGNTLTSTLFKSFFGIAQARSLPTIEKTTLKKWLLLNPQTSSGNGKVVYLFCDEFTNYNDASIGIKTVQLLRRLKYEVKTIAHPESGRAAISKGLITYAQKLANQQVDLFSSIINDDTPLLGIEPSAILSFRDEYPRLVDKDKVASAKRLSSNCLTMEEFLYREYQAGRIPDSLFTKASKKILLHGHCHQKALSSVDYTAWLLAIPTNYEVEVIPSGCCGMAGSFGYEKEHYEVSQKVGELVLFPAVRKAEKQTRIVAPGTSCRHQIKDGTGRKALHPVEVLWEAII